MQRVTLTQGLESAGALVSSKEGISGPSTNSSFLRNLQFDVEAGSSPDARMEWPGAELEAEASLRVRGTWEHPILLGHIHLLSGDLYFAGNRYRVARGDVNFSNPFRLDPVLNVEASTTIQQYEITLNFNGPSSKLALAYRSDPPLPANRHRDIAGAGKDQHGSHGTFGRSVAKRELGSYGATVGSGDQPVGWKVTEIIWDYAIARGSGAGDSGVHGIGTERWRASNGGAADYAEPDDYLRFQCELDTAAGNPGGIHSEPQCFRGGAARSKRNVWYRRKNKEAFQVVKRFERLEYLSGLRSQDHRRRRIVLAVLGDGGFKFRVLGFERLQRTTRGVGCGSFLNG